MEGSNYWGYGYKTQHSEVAVNHLKKARGEIWPKHSGNSNKDEDNSPKTLNDKNQQASSRKFRQLIQCCSQVICYERTNKKCTDDVVYLFVE